MGELRQASTKHNNIRIDDVDDVRQPTRQAIDVPGECRYRGPAPLLGACCNFHCRDTLACRSGVVGSHAWARDPCFETSFASAPALRAGMFLRLRPGKRVVTPFPCYSTRSIEQPSINNDTAAAASS